MNAYLLGAGVVVVVVVVVDDRALASLKKRNRFPGELPCFIRIEASPLEVGWRIAIAFPH